MAEGAEHFFVHLGFSSLSLKKLCGSVSYSRMGLALVQMVNEKSKRSNPGGIVEAQSTGVKTFQKDSWDVLSINPVLMAEWLGKSRIAHISNNPGVCLSMLTFCCLVLKGCLLWSNLWVVTGSLMNRFSSLHGPCVSVLSMATIKSWQTILISAVWGLSS